MSRRWARWLLISGAALAAVAGLVQATVGSRIPSWTGDKADPGPLGALTIALGAVAGVAAAVLTGPRRSGSVRVAAGGALALVCLVGATTVGALWVLPGTLLAIGLVASVDDWRGLVATIRHEWCRVLLVALGCCELLMIVRARPHLAVLGAVAGGALVAAAVSRPRRSTMALAIVATLPFAVLAWTALVPPMVTAAAVLVAVGIRTANVGSPARIGALR